MTDILHWDDMISSSITSVKNLLSKCKDPKTSHGAKLDCVTEMGVLFSRLKSLEKSYRTELLQIGNSTEQLEAKKRQKEFKMEIKKLQADFKWLKSNVENEALMGSSDREEKPVTDEQVASHMLKVQDQDKDLLRQGLNKVNEATKVADVIVQQLDEQTEQLQRINKKASGLQSDIKRAGKILYVYRRRMMQDRATVILLLVVVLGIVGIVIYATINPDQESFAVPDEAKPPTEEEIKKATQSSGRRLLLRGATNGFFGKSSAENLD